jgi:NAD-dependent SIR2 family protein deacetylase
MSTEGGDALRAAVQPHTPEPAIAYLTALGGVAGWHEVSPTASEGSKDAQPEPPSADLRARGDLDDWLKSCLSAHNLIVLAGSGTSLESGVGGPSMDDLWAACGGVRDFAVVLELVRQPPDDNWIENLLSRCKVATEFLNPDDAERVATFLAEAERVIWDRCDSFLGNANLAIHKTFLRRMARRRTRAPRLRIFTTNYDRCFETAASQLGLVAIDGFSFTSPRRFDPRFLSYDLVRRAAGTDDTNAFVEGVIHLLKLHGSVNWDQRGTDVYQADRPATPCLVFPAISKYQRSYVQPYLEMMTQYMTALREPNTCLAAVGFGFQDDHLAAPIEAALDSNPGLKLLVVDRSVRDKSETGGSFHGRLAKRIQESGERGAMLLNATFGQFASLVPDLKALSPAEQLERSIKQSVAAQ